MSNDLLGASPVLPNLPQLPETAVQVRLAVRKLPHYVPGKRLDHPQAVKLSSNEFPEAPPEPVLDAARAALLTANRYPDMSMGDLVEKIAQVEHLSPESVAVGNGASALLVHALATVVNDGDEVIFPWRSFESYPIAVPTVGGVNVPVRLTSRHETDLARMYSKITDRTRAIILCNPNNPTGTTIDEDALIRFLNLVPQRILVILDEAYIEFVDDERVILGVELLAEFPNLVILRTFSKAYRLAGLRVGYLLGEPAVVAAIRKVSTPFGVSSVAGAAALAALNQRDLMLDAVQTVVGERRRVTEQLRHNGWSIPPSGANFFWIPASGPGGSVPERILRACEAEGIAVRCFPAGVRISIGDEATNDRLLRVFAHLEPNPGKVQP